MSGVTLIDGLVGGLLPFFLRIKEKEHLHTSRLWSVKQSAEGLTFTTSMNWRASLFARIWSSWCQCFDLGCVQVVLSELFIWNIEPMIERPFWVQKSSSIRPFEFMRPTLCLPNTSGHKLQSEPTRTLKSLRIIVWSISVEFLESWDS